MVYELRGHHDHRFCENIGFTVREPYYVTLNSAAQWEDDPLLDEAHKKDHNALRSVGKVKNRC